MNLDEAVEEATYDVAMFNTREVSVWNMNKSLEEALSSGTYLTVHRALGITSNSDIYRDPSHAKWLSIDRLIGNDPR